jgi:hypothetical protein
MILRGGIAMLQAPVLDGLPFDPFSFQQDGLSPTSNVRFAPETGHYRGKIASVPESGHSMSA